VGRRGPGPDPRTKPKACNYGLLTARGMLCTVFNAEDRPDPLQLRKAVVALERLGPRYACVQARLGFHGPSRNLLARWFTLEQEIRFGNLLPGLVDASAPVPLGGTSSHFRVAALRAPRAPRRVRSTGSPRSVRGGRGSSRIPGDCQAAVTIGAPDEGSG